MAANISAELIVHKPSVDNASAVSDMVVKRLFV